MLISIVFFIVFICILFICSIVFSTISVLENKNEAIPLSGVFFISFISIYVVPILLIESIILAFPFISDDISKSIFHWGGSTFSRKSIGLIKFSFAISLLLSLYTLDYNALYSVGMGVCLSSLLITLSRTSRIYNKIDGEDANYIVMVNNIVIFLVLFFTGTIGIRKLKNNTTPPIHLM